MHHFSNFWAPSGPTSRLPPHGLAALPGPRAVTAYGCLGPGQAAQQHPVSQGKEGERGGGPEGGKAEGRASGWMGTGLNGCMDGEMGAWMDGWVDG